jgi:hypothetical protein
MFIKYMWVDYNSLIVGVDALIPGNSLAEASTWMIIGGEDFHSSGEPRRAIADAPLAEFFLSYGEKRRSEIQFPW